jgi:hypothetical protein
LWLTNPNRRRSLNLVCKILAIKQRNENADVSALEREINTLVYALYSLTAEEIQTVEGTGDKMSAPFFPTGIAPAPHPAPRGD